MLAIKTSNLCKQYDRRSVVKDLNLEIEEGQLVSLLGVNGAGKTTTIKMLSCLTKPTSGKATIFNHSIIEDAYSAKEIMNVSPQETAIAPQLTTYENLLFICGVYGDNKVEAKRKTKEIIDKLRLRRLWIKRQKHYLVVGKDVYL